MLHPSFTSLYRLFLRTVSASVLHQPRAVADLRALWRPVFKDAAKQHNPEWLKTWDKRADRTLALLYSSAQSRGLPSSLTRNLVYLVHAETHRLRYSTRRYKPWSPQLPPTSPLYKPPQPPTQSQLNREAKNKNWAAMEDSGWAALSEVVRMAEGRDGLLLGRVSVKGRMWKK